MKRLFTGLFLLCSLFTYAYDWEHVSLSGGVEANANYLYRGSVYGGLSAQPWIEVSHYGFTAGAWFNLGSGVYSDFKNFNKEMDVYFSYTTPGEYLTLKVTQFFYFDGSKYFDYRTTEDNSTQTEVTAEIKVSQEYPLIIGINTHVGGGDCFSWDGEVIYKNDGVTPQKLFSTYVSLRYELELDDWEIIPEIGFSPYKSSYTYYNTTTGEHAKFALNNISLKASYNFFENDYVSMYVLGMFHFNLFDVRYQKFGYEKNFGWNVGFGIEL